MPAPAVYVIAVVGSVGVAIAFKEFVYPHIAPRIDRWKAEFQAAKQRRAEAERSAVMAEIALSQRGVGKEGHSNGEDNDSDSDHSDVGFGKGTTSCHPFMKNGLLIRRRSSPSEASKPGDVELDCITSTATGTASQQPDLRLRKNTALNESIPIDLERNNTAESHTFLDESIQAIPYTPLSPIRTPTPSHVLYNSSSTHSPLDSPFSTRVSSPSPEEALHSKLKTNVANTSTLIHPLIVSSQPLSPPSCATDTTTASTSKAESLPPSPPGAPFLSVGVDDTMFPDSSVTSLPSLSSPPALALSSSPSQLLSPTWSHPSRCQIPPHVHAIPSLSQSYPLDDLLDYEHGLELLSPPSPLSRADSPFELAGLSPRSEIEERLTASLAGIGDNGEQISAAPLDSTTNSTRSTTYLSLSSPTLSASSILPSSENGYENDSNPSEISSTFSSPAIEPTRLRDIRLESLSPHDQARLSHSMSFPASRSSPSFDVNHLHRLQQQERNAGWGSMRISVPVFSTPTPRPQESNAQRSMTTNDNEYDDCADTQTLSPRSRIGSPSPMQRTVAESIGTASISTDTHPSESATRLSRATMRDSDLDTGSELSDLDFLNMSAEEFEASASAGLGSRLVVSSDGTGGVVGRTGGIGGPDGNESDTSTWSFAGGSE